MPLSLRASFGLEITQAQIQRNILVYPQQWEMKDALLGLSTWYRHHELRDAPLECFWGQTDCFLKLCVEPHDSWTRSRSFLVKWATARGYAFRFIHAALQRPCCDSRPVHVRQAEVTHRDNLCFPFYLSVSFFSFFFIYSVSLHNLSYLIHSHMPLHLPSACLN